MNQLPSFRPHAGLLKKLPPSDAGIVSIFLFVITIQLGIALYTVNSTHTIEIPVRNGEIHEGVVGALVHKNPLFATNTAERDVAALLHAGLLQYNGAGDYKPHLATDWKQDGSTHIFHLSEKLYFHDGVPITAADVLYTIAMTKRVSTQHSVWNDVSITTPDDRTIIVTIPEGVSGFPKGFTMPILPKHIWQKIPQDQWRHYNGSGIYVGAGPYRHVQESLTIDGRLTRIMLEGYSGYSPQKPYLQQIHIHFFTDTETLLTAFADGRINAMHSITPTEVSALLHQSEDTHTLYTAHTTRVFGIFFNQHDGYLLEDPFIRSILSQLIDRKNIVQRVFYNHATALDSPVITDTAHVETTIQLEEIQQTLEDIGWQFEHAKNRREKNGIPLRVSFIFSDIPEQKQVADILATQWRDLGFEVEMRSLPPHVLRESIRAGEFDIMLYGYEAEHPQDLITLWQSGDRENIASFTGFGTPTLNRLLSELALYSPPERYSEDDNWREMVYTEIKQEMQKRVPAVFLYSPHFLYVLPDDILGVGTKGVPVGHVHHPSDRFMNIHTWYTQKEYIWPFLTTIWQRV